MMFRHEFLHEALAYMPYMECFRNGKVDLVGAIGSTAPARRSWHDTNLVKYRNKDGYETIEETLIGDVWHNEYGPAYARYGVEGRLLQKGYYINCFLHRINGEPREHTTQLPASIYYYPTGEIKTEVYHINGSFARENGLPTEIQYYQSGQIKYEDYYVKGGPHREDGPAIIHWHENGQRKEEQWCIDAFRHRINGPAMIQWDLYGQIRYEAYHIRGKLHRGDRSLTTSERLPAVILYNSDGSVWYSRYYTNGVED